MSNRLDQTATALRDRIDPTNERVDQTNQRIDVLHTAMVAGFGDVNVAIRDLDRRLAATGS